VAVCVCVLCVCVCVCVLTAGGEGQRPQVLQSLKKSDLVRHDNYYYLKPNPEKVRVLLGRCSWRVRARCSHCA
jgi:hypothetical protein